MQEERASLVCGLPKCVTAARMGRYGGPGVGGTLIGGLAHSTVFVCSVLAFPKQLNNRATTTIYYLVLTALRRSIHVDCEPRLIYIEGHR